MKNQFTWKCFITRLALFREGQIISQNDLLFFYSAPPGNEIAGGNTHIRPKWIKIPCNTSVHSRRAELLTVEIRNTSSYR